MSAAWTMLQQADRRDGRLLSVQPDVFQALQLPRRLRPDWLQVVGRRHELCRLAVGETVILLTPPLHPC